jgi:hypothetical protein
LTFGCICPILAKRGSLAIRDDVEHEKALYTEGLV